MKKSVQSRILLAPFDPVHDIGLKMIRQELEKAGHEVRLLPPDYSAHEIIEIAAAGKYEYVMVSRTLGYGIAELLGQFIDLADAAGIREYAKLVIGGMAIRPELAAELGFDAGFGPGTDPLEVVAYVEGRIYKENVSKRVKEKSDLTAKSEYRYQNSTIKTLLDQIVDEILIWSNGRISPAVERAHLRHQMLQEGINIIDTNPNLDLCRQYIDLVDPLVRQYYEKGQLPKKTRMLKHEEQQKMKLLLESDHSAHLVKRLQHTDEQPKVFVQYGTGCPFMDITHIKISEAWGADGVLHFDPSWGARTEGFLEGFIAHEEDGSIITMANLKQIKNGLNSSTLWTVRAHRGLNTPETVVLAGESGADLTKINIVYGSLGAGTDPERLTIDGVDAIKWAARYGLPFDIPTNEELCGVPAYKAFAGMLIVAHLGIRLGARPILKPLFCYSPEVMISGQMNLNYTDYNAAKIIALQRISDIPIWPGEPIGFLTHTEDRVQSATTTALHAALASSLGVPAISIASSDEAYSGGPITAASRIDSLRAVGEAFRFFGNTGISLSHQADFWAEELELKIIDTLAQVAKCGSFTKALYDGILGSSDDGAYPGRSGRGTVTRKTVPF
jgi:methylmalonyl-CoA mutase cobalamin-binding subunit